MPRCLLVSNRLPVEFNPKIQEFKPSSGGLVSAIKGLDPEKVGYSFEWMGIMGDETKDYLKDLSCGKLRCHPILVPQETYDQYYNGYCNNVIWPLFHYESSMVTHSEKGWQSYIEINQMIADAITEEAELYESVWIHDFHFFLVPGMIKQKRPDLKVGFFLHIPFPSSEIFRELPQREEILNSLVQCDLIGFHDMSYLTHFKNAISRVLGENLSIFDERKLGVYPISIDTEHFERLSHADETLEFIKKYGDVKKEMKWVLGVDRLDYIKGLELKLQAMQEYLRKFPEERGKVQLVQVVIPSRTKVPEYQELKIRIERLVSSINGEFGSPTYMPIHYLYHSVSEYELSALYQLSEVMHISSRRDGMNLVCLEYVASQNAEKMGTILLSEFTGAHSTLSYAFSINPWNIEDTALKMYEAIHNPQEKAQREMSIMKDFLHKYTSSDWARFFLRDLHPMEEKDIQNESNFDWMKNLKNKKILFFCDLDGTLVPIEKNPKDVHIKNETKELLKKIKNNKNCEFVVVSGRDQDFLDSQFTKNNLHFPLAACHGAYTYSPHTREWNSSIPYDATKWKEGIIDIFKLYTSRTPGSFIEEKGHSVVWHYRNSPEEFAEFLAKKMVIELEESLTSLPAVVSRGKKIVEVKSLHASKGYFVQKWLDSDEVRPDVVIALGDDTTDEDMFEYLESLKAKDINSYCIKVGKEKTFASYSLNEQQSVNKFLRNFIDLSLC